MPYQTQKELEEKYMMPVFARKPVCLVSGEGMCVQDDAGNNYLDFIAGIGVCSMGHNHPHVVAAIQRQAITLMHVSNYYYIEQRGEAAMKLSNALNDGDETKPAWKSFFANSGAEANECMIKLARVYAKRKGNGGNTIVTLDGSFHGRTMETLAATAQPAKQESFQPLPGGFVHTKPNDIEALRALFAERGSDICGFMFEPIQGEGGVHPCTPEYLQTAAELCDQVGALMLADEIQTGIYRTGTPFAFQQLGITPHIVAIAKGIADGFPMGACSAQPQIAAAFEPGDHGSTFGGSNLAVAAACATLTMLEADDIAKNARVVGAYLQKKLAEIPQITEVRGMGLMVGADLIDGIDANAVVLEALKHGLLLNATGPHTLRFLPPLICSQEDIDALMKELVPLLESVG